MPQTLKIEYSEPEAFEVLDRPKRYKVFFGGRAGAKSWQVAQKLLIQGIEKSMRVLCARELQTSIKESVHKLLSDTIDRLGLQSQYEVLQTTIRHRYNGTEFIFLGLKNDPRKVKSTERINLCWVEEAEAVSSESWGILIPTIREAGSEIWVTFNPNLDTDETYTRFVTPYLDEIEKQGYHEDERIYVRRVSWRDNPWFNDVLREEKDHLKVTNPARYEHVWEGNVRAAVEGAILGEQLRTAKEEGRIGPLPVVENEPVHTFWDLGRNDSNAIWFMQHVQGQCRFIDYYESRLVPLHHYAKVLQRWAVEKGYIYGDHYLPHDVVNTDLSQSENKSRQEVLESLGVRPITVVDRIRSLDEGIEMMRQAFRLVWIDPERVKSKDPAYDGLRSLQHYQYVYDEEFKSFRETPLKNFARNGADAFRQFAQGYDANASNDYDYWGDDVPQPDLGMM